ncbi:MAG: F0F1 ATP synthase subunit epsilon [Pseudomonadota bacterium]
MADTMQFDLVSPERRLASLTVREVQIPGAEGDLTAMPDHAPLITTLRPGLVKASGPDGDTEYAVFGGFAEITSDSASVLAEEALPRDEVTAEFLTAKLTAAASEASEASGDAADTAAKLVADLKALGAVVGRSN